MDIYLYICTNKCPFFYVMGKSKVVIMKNLSGVEMKRYKSCAEAAKDNNLTHTKVNKICLGRIKSNCGFTFEYSGEFSDEKPNPYLNKENQYKCPYCEKRFAKFEGLCKHVMRSKTHSDKTKEELLADSKYGGIRPTCKCGCGEYTNISYANGAHFTDYKLGHASRISNNWGHNIKAKINSANTRREQYASGYRKQWNLGKSFEEAYGKETSDKLKDNIRTKLYDRIKEQKFNISSKLEDIFEETFLSKLKIDYIKQYYLKDIKQFCDFYIPTVNAIIEIDGSFWHCDPNIYIKPQFPYQEEKIKRDLIKNKYCVDNGIKIYRFWEYDILRNGKYVRDKLSLIINDDFQKYIKKLPNSTNHSFVLLDLINDCELKNKPNSLRTIKDNNKNTIFIYEDEWLLKNNIVKDRIDNILGATRNKIYARQCEVRTVERKEMMEFLDNNHIQGGINSKYSYGLYFNGELVSLMTFCGLRKNLGSKQKDNVFELLRFCNKLGYNVVGGASRLLKHFIRENNPRQIISYCDRRWSDGNLYEKLGFVRDHESQENYFYCVGGIRRNRFNYRKDVLVRNGYDENKTEKEIMFERNIMRIYDCGTIMFVLNIGEV